MLKIIVVNIILIIIIRNNKKRKGGWYNPSTMLVGLYLISTILTIPHLIINEDDFQVQYTLVYQSRYWLGAIAFIIFLSLYLFPLLYFKENETKKIIIPNLQILNAFSTLLIIMSLYSIVYYLPSVFRIFRSGVALASLRSNGTYVLYKGTGLLNTVASVSASMYPFVIMLYFIYSIIGKHTVRRALLFIGSTSNIFLVLTFVGRDGVVFWIFCFMYMYLFFAEYFNQRQKTRIRRFFVIGALAAFFPFMLISSSRFSGKTGGTISGILSYMGQMLPNYCLYFAVRRKHYNYGTSFPLFWEAIGKKPPESARWIDGGTESNVFGTFIKGFNINFGLAGTILVGIIAALFFVFIFKKRKNSIYYYHYFIYVLYYQVLSQGVFYFRQYTRGDNLWMLICILFFAVFHFLQHHSSNFVLHKRPEEIDKMVRKKVVIKLGRYRI